MNHSRRRLSLAALVGAGLVAMMANTPAAAWDRGNVETFAVLPAGSTGPEGITIGPEGVYVTTFGFNAAGGPAPGNGQLFVFRENDGKLIRQVNVQNSSSRLLGLAFHPSTGKLLVIDSGNGNVLDVDPHTGTSSVFTGPIPNSVLNALTFDKSGNVFISDSAGKIWKTGAGGGAFTLWSNDSRLVTMGVPPFGANGLQFNKAGNALFVANTGNDTVVKIQVLGNGNAGTATTFVNSINGADGLIMDGNDNVWVCANQEDEIVVVDPNGKGIAKLGDFNGITKDGQARGFLFPASLVFSHDGQWLFVTNLALDLRLFNPEFNAVDSQWAAQVSHYTVSRIKARIPPSFDKN